MDFNNFLRISPEKSVTFSSIYHFIRSKNSQAELFFDNRIKVAIRKNQKPCSANMKEYQTKIQAIRLGFKSKVADTWWRISELQ